MSTSSLPKRLENFSLLESPEATRFFWGRVRFEPELERLSSQVMGVPALVASGRVTPKHPIVVEIVKGGQLGDFIWNDSNLVVASDRVLRLWESHRVSGFSSRPAQVLVPDGGKLEGFSVIAVLGRAGKVDESRSRVTRFANPNSDGTRGIMAISGLYFSPESWDGSDIFCVDDFPLQLILSSKVVRALESAEFSNYKTMPLSEFRFGN